MSSENHSEAFYSADEDTSHGLSGSHTSSLRQSIVGSGSVLNRNDSIKKKFSSDLSIVESSTNVNISIFEKAHTLERAKPQTMSTKRSPRVNRNTSFQNDTDSNGGNGGLRDSSDSHSVSSTSFISAVSSQEDVTLVNLHMQVNKPIVDSPLLMSSYVSHLSQVVFLYIILNLKYYKITNMKYVYIINFRFVVQIGVNHQYQQEVLHLLHHFFSVLKIID